jgi:DNA replication and repair protein RecF
MHLVEASLSGFRNITEARLLFSPGVNIVTGANGQGKTNLLEALNYPALGRSFRGARDDDLVGFDVEAAHVRVLTADETGGETLFEYGLGRGGSRRLRLDGEPVRRKIDLVGRMAAVVYDPQTVHLVRGGPDGRRRYLDQGLCGLDRAYLERLQDCQRILKQKNRLLRDAARGVRGSRNLRDDLGAWNAELAAVSAPLIRARGEYLEELEPLAAGWLSAFADLSQRFEMLYRPGLEIQWKSRENGDLEREILGVLDYIVGDEIRRGRCLVGPQADDVELKLDGVGLRTFGSQGETRSAAIALKLAQGELIHRKRRVHPVLFFDDIFSELDQDRSRHLQETAAKHHQIIIATARDDDVSGWSPDDCRRWTVREGRIDETS